ncbi:MAG: sulfotransferase family protein [Phycisphaeraceae bacterium]|nr:MAG: sulfotransferase family protein [Phycisphaeraceae bacterium]
MNPKLTKAQQAMEIVQRSIAAQSAGRYDEAVALLRQAVRINPNDVDMLRALAQRFIILNEHDEPEKLLRAALRLRPRSWELHYELGSVLLRHGRVHEAMQCMRKSVECNPPQAMPIVELARLLDQSGKLDDFRNTVHLAIARWPEDPSARVMEAVLDIKTGDLESAEARLRKIVEQEGHASSFALPLAWHRLGVVLEKSHRYPEAWEAFEKSRACRFDQMGRPASKVLAHIRANLDSLDRQSIEGWRSRADQLPEPFGNFAMLVGFPRSGTTLLEVVLGTHPAVSTIEEMFFVEEANATVLRKVGLAGSIPRAIDACDDQERREVRDHYLSRCRGYLKGKVASGVILDKHPSRTHLAPFYLWMIPCAKIIMPIRDPRDVVVSNFTQDMQNSALVSLDRIVDFYEACMNGWLMFRAWLGDAAIEVRYEDTVTDLEREARRILDHLGLEWDPALLAFHERAKSAYVGTPSYQAVTQPVNTKAVGRWRRYEAQLRPVLHRLEPFVEAFGYEPS